MPAARSAAQDHLILVRAHLHAVAADTAVAGVPRSRPARARAATCVHPRAVLTFEHVEGRFSSGHGKAVSE